MVKKDRAEVVRETRKEIASTYRVYRKEWIRNYRGFTEPDIQAVFEKRYEGRLYEHDWSIDFDDESQTYLLSVRVWNVAGEWKREELALRWAAALIEEGADPDEIVVVARNSRDEHRLRSYGSLKLKSDE